MHWWIKALTSAPEDGEAIGDIKDNATSFERSFGHRYRDEFQHIAEDLLQTTTLALQYLPTKVSPHCNATARTEQEEMYLSREEEQKDSAEMICRIFKAQTERLISSIGNEREEEVHRSRIAESNSLKRLTVIASLFLPLSLAASILNLQTRFQDLDLKLFDFVCVSIVIGTITLIFSRIYGLFSDPHSHGRGLSQLNTAVQDLSMYWHSWTKPGRRARLSLLRSFLEAGILLALAASSLCGMLKSVTFGLIVLGCGVAGVLLIGIMFFKVLDRLDVLPSLHWAVKPIRVRILKLKQRRTHEFEKHLAEKKKEGASLAV